MIKKPAVWLTGQDAARGRYKEEIMMIKKYTILLIACCLVLQLETAEADVWGDLVEWKMNDGKDIPNKVEELITGASPDQYDPIEDALIKILSLKNASLDARRFTCRMLQQVGTDKCVSALAVLLADKDLAHYARLSLQMMKKSIKAGDALMSALDKAPDEIKPGIIASIAERGDKKAAARISKLMLHKESGIAGAAINALGRIGGSSSAGYLQKTKVAQNMKHVQTGALLECAESLKSSDAVGIYKKVYSGKNRDVHRAAALKGLIKTDESRAVSIIVDLLKGDDSYLRQAVLGYIVMEKSSKLSMAAADVLKSVSTEKKAEIIDLLSKRGDKAVLGSITGYIKSKDKKVREAALMAVGKLGDAKNVKMLLEQVKEGEAGEIAIKSLAGMFAPGIDDALIRELKAKDLRMEAVKVFTERMCEKAGPEMVKLIKKSLDIDIRKKLWKSLAVIASVNDIDKMMSLMLKIKDEKEMEMAAEAIKKSCSRHPDKDKIFSVVSKYYEKADETTRILILKTASITGGRKALELIKEVLRSHNNVLYGKAVRALTAWKDVGAAPDLLDLAKNAPKERTRILALKGYIRVIGVNNKKPKKQKKLKMYRTAVSLSKRADEKKAIISGLKNLKEIEALKILEEYLDDTEVRPEAEGAIVNMSEKMIKKHSDTVKPLLLKIINTSKNNQNIEKARSIMSPAKKKKRK